LRTALDRVALEDRAVVPLRVLERPGGDVLGDAVQLRRERVLVADVGPVGSEFSLAADGKTNKRAMPNPLRLAVIARHHFDDVRLPFPPVALQRLGLALGAPVGRLVGYRETYDPRTAVGDAVTAGV
jgi:hypothetical protein